MGESVPLIGCGFSRNTQPRGKQKKFAAGSEKLLTNIAHQVYTASKPVEQAMDEGRFFKIYCKARFSAPLGSFQSVLAVVSPASARTAHHPAQR
jgi:hypothetical protein